MSENPWTPAPWFHLETEARSDCWIVEDGGDTICQLFYLDEETHSRIALHEDRAEANARLIATSPWLASAIAALFDRDCRYEGENIVIPCGSHSEAIRLVAQARAALRKARGETQ